MKTILLIDDDPQVRVMFSMALTRSGYRVIEADSGVTGLTLARKHLPDLILSDIHMPGGDGASMLREIRRDPELRSKQVVLMTGRPDLVTPRTGMEDGADDFLVKPVSLEALRNCIEARFRRASISWRVEDDMVAQLRSTVPTQLPHECFTPLAGIIGLMEILRADYPHLAPSEVKDIHNDIHLSALRLHRTLRNYLLMLDFQALAPAASPPSPLKPRQVEETIYAGVTETIKLNERRADITVNISPIALCVKASDLSLIVEELLDNACKFSRQGSPILLELNADGSLVITDKGRGLTPEEIKSIGVFQQFDRKKHEQQGLGLGLGLVQKIAANSAAKFSITSQPGEGTRVQVEFPVGKI